MAGWEVRPRNLRGERWLRGVTVVLLLALPALFWAGQQYQLRQTHAVLAQQQVLRAQVDEQAKQLEQLRQRLALRTSGEQVGQQANEQSRLTIKLLEEQIFALQQDLAAYEGVLAPASRQQGLRIRAFDLQPSATPRLFRYKVLLSRVGNDDQPLSGQLEVTLEGQQHGKAISFPLTQLSAELGGRPIRFAFKHFQAIPDAARFAELELPAGFEPRLIRVRAEVQGEKPLESQFKWNDKK
ncbi:MAG: DUF6776 family protein [Pseudomonas sp.]|uniref:DUF6776 family protein n=1 Tax=Pseudomonas sp. TaxID=306 RepID=UPI003391EBFC